MNEIRNAAEFAQDLQRQLDEQLTNYPVEVFETLDSTNLYAKSLARKGADRALVVAIEQTAGRGIRTEIKWVNDLYYRGRKVCGILAEAVRDPDVPTQYAIIIGVGINLRHAEFPTSLAEVAGSLDADDADPCDLITVAVDELSTFLDDPSGREWLDDYRLHSCVIGKEIKWTCGDTVAYGKAIDTDADGGLIVLTEAGERIVLSSGEISVRVR